MNKIGNEFDECDECDERQTNKRHYFQAPSPIPRPHRPSSESCQRRLSRLIQLADVTFKLYCTRQSWTPVAVTVVIFIAEIFAIVGLSSPCCRCDRRRRLRRRASLC